MTTLIKDPNPGGPTTTGAIIYTDQHNKIIDRLGGETALTANHAIATDASGNLETQTTTKTELGYLNGVTSAIQTQLDGKAANSHTHAATDIGDGSVDDTEFGYLNGVTGAIQTQIDGKISASSTDTLTNKTIDADGTGNSITNIENADIKAGAGIVYSKLNLTGGIVNADVNASAAIAYSKLNLSGSIVNADVSGSAAIAYSKLNLSGSIVNADVGASAAIAFSKLAALTSANILVGNSSNVAASVAVSGDISLANTGAVTVGNVGNTATITVKDANLTIQDNGDTSKQLQFQCSGITASNTRTMTIPDYNLMLVGFGNTNSLGANQFILSGTATKPLKVIADAGAIASGVQVDGYGGANDPRAELQINGFRGSVATPSAITSGDIIGRVVINGYDGAAVFGGAVFRMTATENWDDSPVQHGFKLQFFTKANTVSGAATNNLTIEQDSTLTIGANQRLNLSESGLTALRTKTFSDTASAQILDATAVTTVSPTSPNRTLTVNYAGTTYYIHCKTTND